MSKRNASGEFSGAIIKKAKGGDATVSNVKSIVRSSAGSIITRGPQRTSDLQAPIMLLKGHKDNVTSVAFAPSGAALATGSFDKEIFLWNTFGDCVNYDVLKGHKGAVLSVKWSSDGGLIYSSSADCSAAVWDSESCTRVKKIREHFHVVCDIDACPSNPELFVTGADDGLALLWDLRHGKSRGCLETEFQITSVAYSKDGSLVYTGSLDNQVKAWDIRTRKVLFFLQGHRDTITSTSLSPDGSYLLTNSRDNTVRVWDAKPFTSRNNRCLKIFQGAVHNFENNLLRAGWSFNGSRVGAGSADRCVYVWNTTNREIIYKLPGHKGVVNQVVFHPQQPIIASVGADKNVFLGEIEK